MKTKLTWMLAAILCCGALLFTSCSDDESSSGSFDEVEEQLRTMTLREKVGQMFYVRPEALAPSIEWNSYDDLQIDPLQAVTEEMKYVNEQYPVGGVILYAWNIDDKNQLARIISDIRKLKGQLVLCIDEEGGRIARIAQNPNIDVEVIGPMGDIGETENPQNAYYAGNVIGTYLSK